MEQHDIIKISKKTFLFSAAILLALMIAAGVISLALPAGSYERDAQGLVLEGSYRLTGGEALPVWRWFTAPFEVLAGPDGLVIIVIIVFLFFLGAAFTVFNQSGALKYGIWVLGRKFYKRKYLLLSAVSLFFMLLGSFAGIFEESVLLAPVAVALCLSLGFDVYTGLFISLLSVSFGFSAGIFNPFTTGIAQRLAGLPVFSGAGFRILGFAVVFLMLNAFIQVYARKAAAQKAAGEFAAAPCVDDEKASRKSAAALLLTFVSLFLWVIAMSFVEGLSDYTMPVLAVLFLAGGIAAGFSAGMGGRGVLRALGGGCAGVAPGVLLILMASSVKYILSESMVMDTILYRSTALIQNAGRIPVALGIYLLVLVLDFFISSGSAKVFLIMPVISPIAQIAGLSAQTAVLAYLFGDGFSNSFYITNAVLLITLGITGASYAGWFKRIWPLQLATLAATAGLVVLACAAGY